MAKLLSIEGTLSGSINGVTYSHNRGGAYKRARKIPTISASPKASFAKAFLGGISSQWNLLTAPQRIEWQNWASLNPVVDVLGSSILLSGQQAYIALNARAQAAGFAQVTNPPVDDGPTNLLTMATTPTVDDGISCAFTPALPTGMVLAYWMTLPGTAGRNPNINQARLVGYSAVDAASPATFTTPYLFESGNAFNAFATIVDPSGRMAPRIAERVLVP